jgi:hypothetical protein
VANANGTPPSPTFNRNALPFSAAIKVPPTKLSEKPLPFRGGVGV